MGSFVNGPFRFIVKTWIELSWHINWAISNIPLKKKEEDLYQKLAICDLFLINKWIGDHQLVLQFALTWKLLTVNHWGIIPGNYNDFLGPYKCWSSEKWLHYRGFTLELSKKENLLSTVKTLSDLLKQPMVLMTWIWLYSRDKRSPHWMQTIW